MKNQKQIDAINDGARFKFILAGRRGGKTFLITHDMEQTISELPPYGEIFYIGPTNQQSKELMWEPLEKVLYEQGWKYNALISKQRFEFSHKRKIYIMGAEKCRRIRGHAIYKAYLDELAYFSVPISEVWRALRPALSDYRGKAIAATTPDGKGSDAYDFYLETKQKENWKYFHWKTIDNPWIDKEEIDEAKHELDEKSFKQEYEAEWQSFEGLAYYNFDEDKHIKKQPHLDPVQPLHLAFDFNVNPTTLLLSQKDGDMLRYKKEYSFKNSSTEATVQAFCEDYKDHKNSLHLKIRGDASGKSRSANTGKSDYYYVEQLLNMHGFKYSFEVKAKNPPIVDRVKTVNSWLKPMKGKHRIEVDPACTDLIRDLTSQALNGRHPSDSNNLGHKADAFGYDVFFEQIIGRSEPQRTVRL